MPAELNYRPYGLLAEITYRCPLRCPYCSNPATIEPLPELTTADWVRVISESSQLGVMQVGFSGGEPLARPDLEQLVAAARQAGLYTNLLTSGLGLDQPRAEALAAAGLDSLQLSFQADEPILGDEIAGVRAHERKLVAAKIAREAGLTLSVNAVLHRRNIDRLEEIIQLAESIGASRLELANVQFHGWAFENRKALLPTREQATNAFKIGAAAKERLRGRLEVFYVLPDYYEQRPKACMHGWGRKYICVNPVGQALPCPTAGVIPGLHFDNVRQHDLAWIWRESEAFRHFRGTAWMPEPCRSCPQKEIDFGGCRCQAALWTGDGASTDPVCSFSPHRRSIDALLAVIGECEPWTPRSNAAYTVGLRG